VNRPAALLTLPALYALYALQFQAASAATDTNITIDPNIAKASAEADADAGTDVPESAQSPYQKALLNYKSGKYEAAKVLIDAADQEQPGDVPIEMLKVRILTELHDFKGAHQVLNSLYDRSDLTPAYAAALALTTGDLNLRQHRFEEASKAYTTYLRDQPNDVDAKLKLIYARLGVGDRVQAGKLESELKPLDAASPAYYFAHAALARSGAASGDEEQDFQQARTIYGITLTNRYLKTFLEVFTPDKGKDAALNPPPPSSGGAPSGKAQ
jgi:tetratricopeptide (TPR) repeat protein